MPTYDYRCEKCSYDFEAMQSIKEPHLTRCPSCGEESLKRLFGSGGAVVFKGHGFYQTDYKSPRVEPKRKDGAPS